MKVGAGILGILWGIIAFLTFGLFVGGLGSIGETVGRAAGGDTSTVQVIKYVGIGLPLLALVGGVVSFGQGTVGGIMLIVAAVGILWISHVTFLGLVIAGPLALAGVLAFIGQHSGDKAKAPLNRN